MEKDRGNCLCQRPINSINCVYSFNCGDFMCCDCFKGYCLTVVLPDESIVYVDKIYEPLFVQHGSVYKLPDTDIEVQRHKNILEKNNYLKVLDRTSTYRDELVSEINKTFEDPDTRTLIGSLYPYPNFEFDLVLHRFGHGPYRGQTNPDPIDINRILNGFYNSANRNDDPDISTSLVLSNFRGYPGRHNNNSLLGDYAGAANTIIISSIVKVFGNNPVNFPDENKSIELMTATCPFCKKKITRINRLIKKTDAITKEVHRFPDKKPQQLSQQSEGMSGGNRSRSSEFRSGNASYSDKYLKYKSKYLSLLKN